MSINKDGNSTIKNLCKWDLYFPMYNTQGEVKLMAEGIRDLNNSEIIAQVNNNNIMFVGTDGQGSHARIYIEDEELRKHVGFENDGKKQQILSDEVCEIIFALKTQKAFEDNVKKEVVLNHEKKKIMEYAKKIKCNEYDKIAFLEDYTGFGIKDNRLF